MFVKFFCGIILVFLKYVVFFNIEEIFMVLVGLNLWFMIC